MLDADAVDEGDEPTKRRRLPRIPRIPLPSWKAVAASLTILVIAALLAGSGYMYWNHRQGKPNNSAGPSSPRRLVRAS